MTKMTENFLVWRNVYAIENDKNDLENCRKACQSFLDAYNELELGKPLSKVDFLAMKATYEQSISPALVIENLLVEKLEIPDNPIGKLKTDKRAALRNYDLSATIALTRIIEKDHNPLFSYCEKMGIGDKGIEVDKNVLEEIEKRHTIYAVTPLEKALYAHLEGFRLAVDALDEFCHKFGFELKYHGNFGWTDTLIHELIDHGSKVGETVINREFFTRVASNFPKENRING